MIPFILFALLVGQVTIGLIWAHRRAHRLSTCTWDQLMAKLEPLVLPWSNIEAAEMAPALRGLSEPGSETLWELFGGTEGLRRMESNARIMIEMASYMERRNNVTNMILADRMRRDGAVVIRAARSIRLARYVRTPARRVQATLVDAAKSYNAMKLRLPALFEMSISDSFSEMLKA